MLVALHVTGARFVALLAPLYFKEASSYEANYPYTCGSSTYGGDNGSADSSVAHHHPLDFQISATIVAIVVIAAMLSLLAWAAPFERSGVGAEAANPNAGQFVPLDRDDPWNLHRLASNW
jgi:hypothetical protein